MRTVAVTILGFASFASAIGQQGAACHKGHIDAGYKMTAMPPPKLMQGIGTTSLKITTNSPEAQAYFNQGLALTHCFWDFEAYRAFKEAARLDPNCGIAYWGMSLANETLNPGRAKQFAAEAARHKTGLTEREQLYIDAIGKADGYRKLQERYPDDLEARAFEVWRVWHK